MQLALWDDVQTASQQAFPRRPKHRDVRGRDAYQLAQPKPPERPQELATALVRSDLDARAEHFEQEAHAARTRASYQGEWRTFERWCSEHAERALPASVDTLRRYLTHLAELGRKVSTIRHARKCIGLAHAHAGLTRPDQDVRIRNLERGMGRELGSHEEGVTPLLEHEVAQIVAKLGRSPREDRDRALILLGFAGAFRAGDLAGLDMDSYRFTTTGVRVLLRRSKEDQLGKGTHTDIPRGARPETCPVEALRTWIARVGRPAGPLFRVVHGARIECERISTRAVARAVQRATARAGLEGHFGAHSLRSGLATSAYAAGATEREIQKHGRWKDRRSLDRYIDVERMPGRRNVAEGLL